MKIAITNTTRLDDLIPLEEILRQMRIVYAELAVELAGGDKTKAARRLGIARSHLYRLLDEAQATDCYKVTR